MILNEKSILYKAIFRFYAISIKIITDFFSRTWQTDFKIYREM